MFFGMIEIPRHGLLSLCPWYHRTPHTSSSKLTLLPDLTRPFSKNSLPLSLGILLDFTPMRCPKSLALIVLEPTLVKLEGVFQRGKRNTFEMKKMCKTGSNISVHAWRNNHSVDFNNARVNDKGNFRIRKTLESWHIANTNKADNNSKPLPKQYSILLD